MTDFTDCYEDGFPIKCYKCGCIHIDEHVRVVIDVYQGMGPTAEAEYICRSCKTSVAYWSYGQFQSDYVECKWSPGDEDACVYCSGDCCNQCSFTPSPNVNMTHWSATSTNQISTENR